MTDKQIICKCNDKECGQCSFEEQLKRKEQECEELQTELKNFKEQIKLQNNFIDSLLKATNNSEWLDKSMLDDEASEIIEKIELDYAQLDQLKAENIKFTLDSKKLVAQYSAKLERLKQILDEIKEIVERCGKRIPLFEIDEIAEDLKQILQKISEVEDVGN